MLFAAHAQSMSSAIQPCQPPDQVLAVLPMFCSRAEVCSCSIRHLDCWLVALQCLIKTALPSQPCDLAHPHQQVRWDLGTGQAHPELQHEYEVKS